MTGKIKIDKAKERSEISDPVEKKTKRRTEDRQGALELPCLIFT